MLNKQGKFILTFYIGTLGENKAVMYLYLKQEKNKNEEIFSYG